MQVFLNGILSGSAIALLAVAFQVVYLPTRVFFLGLAGLYALAPYVCATAGRTSGLWSLSVLASVAMVVVLAVGCEWFNHAPLSRRGGSEGAHLVSSLGFSIVIVQCIAMVWGNEPQTLRSGIDVAFHVLGADLTGSQLLMGVVASSMLIGFVVTLGVTDVGLKLRALADNPTLFALYGNSVTAYRVVAFAVSGVFAAAASLLTAYDLGFDPQRGLHTVLLAVVAVIIGGRSSFWGSIAGGLLLGLVRAQVVWLFSARWQEAVTFTILVVILLLRPEGVFGRRERLEARV